MPPFRRKARKWKRLTVNVSPDMERELRQLAKMWGVPLSGIVREALKRFLVESRMKEAEEIRARNWSAFVEAGLLTDEDVFEAVS